MEVREREQEQGQPRRSTYRVGLSMIGNCIIRGIAAHSRRFLKHAGGSMTIPAIVFFTMLMAVGGLAVDLQRLYGVHGQMQAYVDGVALAGAGELDGQTGSLTRSFRAAWGDGTGGPLVAGTQNFAEGAAALSPQKVTFLSVLGTDPGPIAPTPAAGDVVLCTYENGIGWTPAACSTDTTYEKSAKFIEVVATERTVNYIVLPVADVIGQLFGAAPITSQATLRLRATAGFKAKVCDIHPMMVCNPDEPVGNLDTKYPFTPAIGQQILMKASGNGFWGPGDFGLLQVPNDAGGTLCNGNGAGALACMLALVDPLTHCIDDVVAVKPGQAETTSDGINVRFDIYDGSMNQHRNDPNFAPSVNVTKGVCKSNGASCLYNGNNACNAIDATPAANPSYPLPRDPNLQADTTATVRFGDSQGAGAAQLQTAMNNYWQVNHGAPLPGGLVGKTRYDVYRYEIEQNLIPNIANGERGAVACSSSAGVDKPARDRRMLTMAAVNCRAANGGAGLQGMNNGANLPVVAYLKMFLTEPIGLQIDPVTGKATGRNNVGNVYGEVTGVAAPNDQSGLYHVYPVLYR